MIELYELVLKTYTMLIQISALGINFIFASLAYKEYKRKNDFDFINGSFNTFDIDNFLLSNNKKMYTKMLISCKCRLLSYSGNKKDLAPVFIQNFSLFFTDSKSSSMFVWSDFFETKLESPTFQKLFHSSMEECILSKERPDTFLSLLEEIHKIIFTH